MAGNNIKRYFPPGDPTSDPLAHLYQLFYQLETRSGNTDVLAANTASNLAAFIASHSNNSGGGGNAAIQIGNHAGRIGSSAILYIESDRNYAIYGNNGVGWRLVEATWVGSFENRYGDIGSNDVGALWLETSRNNVSAIPPWLTFRWDGNNWNYIEGQISRNQNGLSTLFATLGPQDANMLISVLDYRHQLQWQNNNTTTWGPNDDGRAGEGPIFREVDPAPATGWHLYDGSTVNYLQANGTTASVALPDLTSSNAAAAYLKAGSPDSGPNAPIAPIFTGNSLTPSGTVTVSSFTPSGNVSGVFTGDVDTTTASNTSAVAQNGTGANFSYSPPTHTHTVVPTGNISASFTGNPVTPTANFTGNAVTPTGSISNNGEPRNLVRRPWFRQ